MRAGVETTSPAFLVPGQLLLDVGQVTRKQRAPVEQSLEASLTFVDVRVLQDQRREPDRGPAAGVLAELAAGQA